MASKGKVKRFTYRKHEGDDYYSWAVFDRKHPDIPVLTGQSRTEAKYEAKKLNEEHPN